MDDINDFLASKEPEEGPDESDDLPKFKKTPIERLTVDIRDKFFEFANTTEEIETMSPVKNIKSIQINLSNEFPSLNQLTHH